MLLNLDSLMESRLSLLLDLLRLMHKLLIFYLHGLVNGDLHWLSLKFESRWTESIAVMWLNLNLSTNEGI